MGKEKTIKLKTCTVEYLEDLIAIYEQYGYKLKEIRPKSFWKDGCTIADHIAILTKPTPLLE